MDDVLEQLDGLTGRQVSDLSHEEPGWLLTEFGDAIPYATAGLGYPQVSTPTSRRLAQHRDPVRDCLVTERLERHLVESRLTDFDVVGQFLAFLGVDEAVLDDRLDALGVAFGGSLLAAQGGRSCRFGNSGAKLTRDDTWSPFGAAKSGDSASG